jgi:hypothetical protein
MAVLWLAGRLGLTWLAGLLYWLPASRSRKKLLHMRRETGEQQHNFGFCNLFYATKHLQSFPLLLSSRKAKALSSHRFHVMSFSRRIQKSSRLFRDDQMAACVCYDPVDNPPEISMSLLSSPF